MRSVIRYFLLLTIILLITACGRSAPSRFFTLPGVTHDNYSGKVIRNNTPMGVGPVQIAKYLQQPQIVTRKSATELKLDEFNRWAAPLKDNIAHVLTENMRVILRNENVYEYPWKDAPHLSLQAKVAISKFDTDINGRSQLQAQLSIVNYEERCVIKSKSYRYQTMVLGELNSTNIVSAMNTNLTRLSYDMARQLAYFSNKQAACIK